MRNSLALSSVLILALWATYELVALAEVPLGSSIVAPLATTNTPKPSINFDVSSRIGIVDVDDYRLICLRVKNPAIDEGSAVAIVTSISETPQRVVLAKVNRKLDKSCVSDSADSGDMNPGEDHYYSLELANRGIDSSEIGIGLGVICDQNTEVIVRDKLATVDLNNDGKAEFFRLCASNEGLHLTVWTGKPLRGKRIWHSYYYLRYDTEPDCKKKDWKN